MASVDLKITRNESGKYNVVVNGTGFHNARGKKAGVKMKGSDEWFDETLFKVQADFPPQVGPDGSFTAYAEVSGSSLNEDWLGDEVYAVASVPGYPSIKSNLVKGDY